MVTALYFMMHHFRAKWNHARARAIDYADLSAVLFHSAENSVAHTQSRRTGAPRRLLLFAASVRSPAARVIKRESGIPAEWD